MGYSLTEYGVKYYAASNDLLLNNDTEETTTSSTAIKIKENQIKERIVTSSFRIEWEVKSNAAASIVNSQLYVNGEYTGNQFSDNTGVYQTATFDINGITEGDLIQLYGYAITPVTTCFVKNFKILGIETIGVINIV